MALETFKKVIRSKAKELNANLSQARIDAIAAKLHAKNPDLTEEADHEDPVNTLNDLMPFADIAKDDDRLRTLEKKAPTKKSAAPENPTNEDLDKKTSDDDAPAWAKALIDKVTKLETEKAQGANRSKAADLLKAKGIPASFLKDRAIPEKDEEVDAFVESLSAVWEETRQDLITQGLMTATPPGGGDPKAPQGKALESAIDNWAKSKVEKKDS